MHENSSTSSSKLVLEALAAHVMSSSTALDADIEREIVEYFAENGIPGGAGGVTSSGFFYNRQGVPAASWIIQHNLNKYPQVTLIDDEGNRFEADIFYSNLNQVTVVFAEPTTGKAVLV